MTDFAIETTNLNKEFKGHLVVDNLNLQVPRGSVYGFLGPNGSGKTTTVRMLMGLAYATSGSINVLGSDMPKSTMSVLPKVGAMIEGPAFYPFMNGRQNLERFDVLARSSSDVPKANIDHALELVGLSHATSKKFRAYSMGMRQRLSLASALMYPRELLVLDEPTNGLDPQGTREVRNLVRRLNEDGTTVFISSHLLDEIDQICTHAVVLRAGKTLAQGPIEEIRGAQKSVLRITTPDSTEAVPVLSAVPALSVAVEQHGDGNDVLLIQSSESLVSEELVALLVRANIRVRAVSDERPSLEDAFVALTGEGFDVAE